MRVGYNPNCFFLDELDLIKILLRDAAKNHWTVAEVRLNKCKIECFNLIPHG
jgi:hypothetical protein